MPDLLPSDEIVKLKLEIRRGGYNETAQGWTDGYATKAPSGSVYLNVVYKITSGAHIGKKIFSRIGLRGLNGRPYWRRKGHSIILGILNSAHGFAADDLSKSALQARRIISFKDIDGLEFSSRIKVFKNQNGEWQNDIDEPIVQEVSDAASNCNQKEFLNKLSTMKTKPIWMQM